MKLRAFAIAIVLLVAAAFAGAQSLKDNQFMRRSVELRALADKAFEEGEYDEAARLAAEAAEQARLSNKFVEESIIQLDAQKAIRQADAAITKAIANDVPSRRPAEYGSAAADLVAARAAFGDKDFYAARDRARAALAGLNLIAKADGTDFMARAEEENSYIRGVGADKVYAQNYSTGMYELVAGRDALSRSDWAMAYTRALGASAAFGRVIALDAQGAVDAAFQDIAWARSVGAVDLYPEDLAAAEAALSDALDAQAARDLRGTAAAARASSAAVSEIARKDAGAAIAAAKEGTAWALALSADYPAEFERATGAVIDADAAYGRGEWRVASERARAASAAVAEIAKGEAAKAIAAARERVDYADSVGGADDAPDEYDAGLAALADADAAFGAEDWSAAAEAAREASRLLDLVAKADAADAIMAGSVYQSWAESAGAAERRSAEFARAVAALSEARDAYGSAVWRAAAAKAREASAGFDALARMEAEAAIAAAEKAYGWAQGSGAGERQGQDFAAAAEGLGAARSAYEGFDYRSAYEKALGASAALDRIARAEADYAIALADAMLGWAADAKAGERYPGEMAAAQAARGEAEAAYLGRGWLAAIDKANGATSILDSLAKRDADKALWLAKAWLDWDVLIEAPKYYPEPYGRAAAAVAGAEEAYASGAYITAAERAMTSAAISYDGIAGAEAEATVTQAYEWLSWAYGIEAPFNFPSEYGRSLEALDKAYDAYVDGYWIPAAERAREAIAALAGVEPVERPAPPPAAQIVLPASYKVRLLPERRDCFWRIAEYPFVYGDPLKWPLLYEANKKALKDPSNPNLIHPGQVFVIPVLGGEVREGAWDATKAYPAFPKK